MELDNLIEQSTFLNKYKYLLKLYKPEELNLSVILGHYRRKLNIFFFNDYPTKSNIENFKNENLKLETLSNYKTLVECALKNNYIKSEDLKQLITWNSNPSEW